MAARRGILLACGVLQQAGAAGSSPPGAGVPGEPERLAADRVKGDFAAF